MSRYEFKHLARDPEGDEQRPYAVFAVVTPAAKRFVDESRLHLRAQLRKLSKEQDVEEHLDGIILKGYAVLAIDGDHPHEYKAECEKEGKKCLIEFDDADVTTYEGLTFDQIEALDRYLRVQNDLYHRHWAEVCGAVTAQIKGSLKLLNPEWLELDWPPLTPQTAPAALDTRATQLEWHLSARELMDYRSAVSDHLASGGLKNGQAGK